MDLVDLAKVVRRRVPTVGKYLPTVVKRRLNRLLPEGEVVRRLSDDIGTGDLSGDIQDIIEQVWPLTMTSKERLAALITSIDYLIANDIPGAIVECGLWKGGSLLSAILRLQALGRADREIFGFDTFSWMTEPTEFDVDLDGKCWREGWSETVSPSPGTSQHEVHGLLTNTGYPSEQLNLVAGRVEDTLPSEAPGRIALLRLDTDWYESTRHELVHLYPRLAVGGILIIDDYGHFKGCQKAVDEYFSGHRIYLQRIDYTGRLAVKQEELRG